MLDEKRSPLLAWQNVAQLTSQFDSFFLKPPSRVSLYQSSHSFAREHSITQTPLLYPQEIHIKLELQPLQDFVID